MSGNCGVVAICVTHPLCPFRVPLTVICSLIFAALNRSGTGGWCWMELDWVGRTENPLPSISQHKKRRSVSSAACYDGSSTDSYPPPTGTEQHRRRHTGPGKIFLNASKPTTEIQQHSEIHRRSLKSLTDCTHYCVTWSRCVSLPV